jgi:hypothetical protein
MKIIIDKIIIEEPNEGSFDFKNLIDQFVDGVREKFFKVHDRIDLLKDSIAPLIKNNNTISTKPDQENKTTEKSNISIVTKKKYAVKSNDKKRVEKSASWKTKIYKCVCGEEFHKAMKNDIHCPTCREAIKHKVKQNKKQNTPIPKDTHVPYKKYQED